MKKLLIVPDTHAPYHDERAVRIVESVIDHWQPDIFVCLGDWVDNLALSGHTPNKVHQGPNAGKEILAAATRLESLSRGIKERHFIMGNHETRLERYIAQKAPALDGMLDIADALCLQKWDSVTPYNETLKLGKVHFTHDVGKAGQNAHRSAAASYMGSVVIGHTHRMAYEVVGRQAGPPIVATMFGWLGNSAAVDYLHRAEAKRWPLGFGIGYMEPSGVIHLQPVPIVNYKCVVEGRLYDGR
jgi:predicted phosphodiesterase